MKRNYHSATDVWRKKVLKEIADIVELGPKRTVENFRDKLKVNTVQKQRQDLSCMPLNIKSSKK